MRANAEEKIQRPGVRETRRTGMLEEQVELFPGLRRLPRPGSHRKTILLLENYLLGKIREKGRRYKNCRMPNEQMVLDL